MRVVFLGLLIIAAVYAADDDIAKKLHDDLAKAETKVADLLKNLGPKLHDAEVKGLQDLLKIDKAVEEKLKDWEAHAHTEVGKAILHKLEEEAEVVAKKISDEVDRLSKEHTLRKRAADDSDLASKLTTDLTNAKAKIEELIKTGKVMGKELEINMLHGLVDKSHTLLEKLKSWEAHAHTEIGKAILHFVEQEAEVLVKKIETEVERLSH